MIWCLAQQNPALAVRALEDVVSCFKTDGSFECINEGYEKLPLFVVSATNVCGGFERTISDFPEFCAERLTKLQHQPFKNLTILQNVFFYPIETGFSFAIKKLSCDPLFITGQLFFFYS